VTAARSERVQARIAIGQFKFLTEFAAWGNLPDRVRACDQGLGRLRIELPDEGPSLETIECDLLRAALEKHDWNQTKAAAYLDITRSALRYPRLAFHIDPGFQVRVRG
jgi:transcriptional regulator with AAA-type ATPase domain